METVKYVLTGFAAVGESTITAIALAFMGLIGTIATVGYKYKSNKPKPEDNQKILFEQVNQFIQDQKTDRDALRQELQEVRDELDEVRRDNRLKDLQIDKLVRDNNELREELKEMQEAAKVIAATKIKEDEAK